MLDFQSDYTFDRFLVTPNNEMAFDAANAIVEEMGTRYNPFFLYGGFGSGKTHLLHAIGNAAQKKQTGMRIALLKGKDLLAEISFGLKKHKLTNFYQRYQNYDLLLIDNFEALVWDDVAQNVALRLFDALWKQHKQIIVMTGMPTHRFPIIEGYFWDSYDTGLIAEIFAPEILVKNREILWRDWA
jgi:chromosomal replication initiator protein